MKIVRLKYVIFRRFDYSSTPILENSKNSGNIDTTIFESRLVSDVLMEKTLLLSRYIKLVHKFD